MIHVRIDYISKILVFKVYFSVVQNKKITSHTKLM